MKVRVKKIKTYIKNTVFSSLSNLLDRSHRGPVEVAVVLSGLYELVVLNISLHGLPRLNKMVIATIDLKLSSRSRRMWNTRAETVRVFRDELVINTVLQGAQDDHGARVVDLDFLH